MPLPRAPVFELLPWTARERAAFARLGHPHRIQDFLDAVAYSADPIYRSPRAVLRDKKAHCYDGALFAAAALWRLGHPPLLVDLRAARDDDHVLAVFRRGRLWGAVAKSNFVGLRFREPIHRSLRELALSYFEDYYNLEGMKSLRSYSPPLDLRRIDPHGWATGDGALDAIAARLDRLRHRRLLSAAAEAALRPIDPRTYEAGMLGAVQEGLYQPGGHKG
ncbi:MAG: hypothetical protein HY744_32805 [Deltaproteobacteria bacterium]|nr:hypothetical protein [Deltaproteobacteria bacterium]